MKSFPGFFASVVFLLMLPLAVFVEMLFINGAETTIHFAGAVGFLLISISVFDFKLPKWINLFGCLALAILGLIFLLQGVSNLIQNESLAYFAFQVLGQRLENWLVDLLILWFVMLVLLDSRGKIKIFGIVVMTIVVGLEIYSFILSYLGSSLDEKVPALKILYLLIFVWFIFESKQIPLKNHNEIKSSSDV